MIDAVRVKQPWGRGFNPADSSPFSFLGALAPEGIEEK